MSISGVLTACGKGGIEQAAKLAGASRRLIATLLALFRH
jgi:hypothetical protein